MPYLPFLAEGERRPSERQPLLVDRVPFSQLADYVCVPCASGVNLNCGFSNFALNRVRELGDAPAHWCLETLSCMCAQCESFVADSSDADKRRTLVDRHRFDRLDTLLGVDAPPTGLPPEHNAVPVLELRRCLVHAQHADTAASLRARFAESCHWPQLFGSARGTARWLFELADDARTELYETLSLTNAERSLCDNALDWPSDIDRRLEPSADGRHWLVSACLVRVATAQRIERELQRNARYEAATRTDTRWLATMAQLFVDTHLDLFVMIDLFGYSDDGWLETPFSANMIGVFAPAPGMPIGQTLLSEVTMRTPFETFYPHPLRGAFAGELADAMCGIGTANIWREVQPKVTDQVTSFIHVFLCKSMNHKCRCRQVGGWAP